MFQYIEVSMTTEMKVRLCNLQVCFQVCFEVCFEVCLLVIEGLYSSVQVWYKLSMFPKKNSQNIFSISNTCTEEYSLDHE